jgi:hypothetical protein
MTDAANITEQAAIDLSPFCSTDATHSRYYIMQPWSRGDFTWATDGHILVRVSRRANVPEVPKPPNTDQIMACHDGAEFAPLPDVVWPDPPPPEKCNWCDGRGVYDNDPCDSCHGTGLGPSIVSVGVRGAIFNAKYIRMIMALPSAEFSIKPGADKPAPFRFDGGLGALMPMSIEARFHHFGDIELLARNVHD